MYNEIETMQRMIFKVVPVLLVAAFAGGSALGEVLAPGWGKLEYAVPVPGTYALPPVYPAAGGEVLTTGGVTADLDDFFDDRIVVLSFMYTSCDDINGCPLSIFVLHNLQDKLRAQPEIADKVRFISFSFDVEKDTPEVLHRYQQQHGGSHPADHAGHHQAQDAGDAGAEWVFLVSASRQALQPVLKSYSQFVIPEIDEGGEDTGKFSHLLRVFLIDERGMVRNIYSPSFLHPDILLADIKNILFFDTEG